MTRFDGYQGTEKPKIKDLTFKIYQSLDAAYNDVVSGSLDFMETIPTSALAGQKYKTDLANRYVEKPTLQIQMIGFPYYVPAYASADLHKAVSMAINREEITKKIFEGARIPADGWMIPGIKGYKKGQCGEFCTFNPTKAKEYLAKSGFTGPLTIASNSDGGHKEWIEATCNSIKNALGIDCRFVPTVSFGDFRKAINAKQMTGIFRHGWLADYPSIEDFLNPLYKTGASSNNTKYSNPALDAALVNADKAPSEDAAIAGYQQAEAMLAQDMPDIPLWTYVTQAGSSTKVKNVKVTADRKLDLYSIEAA
jgi:oligopeptide transport system substrate-binding protein